MNLRKGSGTEVYTRVALLATRFLLVQEISLHFNPDDRCDMLLRNVGDFQIRTTRCHMPEDRTHLDLENFNIVSGFIQGGKRIK
jgi:hypothetical protein